MQHCPTCKKEIDIIAKQRDKYEKAVNLALSEIFHAEYCDYNGADDCLKCKMGDILKGKE